MSIELLVALLSLAAGAIPAALKELAEVTAIRASLQKISSNEIVSAVMKALGIELVERPVSAEKRVQLLLRKFTEVSAETDAIVQELTQQIESRSALVHQLESEEDALEERIEALRSRPEAEIVNNLARLEARLDEMNRQQAKEGRRSAWRDYSLYVLGVLTPIVITVVLRYVFNIQL